MSNTVVGTTSNSEPAVKLPFTMTAAYGEARFTELYEKALLRKSGLCGVYPMHMDMALYDCDVLPEDPMVFIQDYVNKQDTGAAS
ncbi:hypothetical protein HaLaN_13498 [Haematococcus lacustris]|uniref:Uncharacterized protein n=1 Tax=Haematococcus lacustris TaxID=44745 RepID=A0A699ZME1_HAELA|nr:hypothetical protein HaLaN_13498 [Haematococcus lacustris]